MARQPVTFCLQQQKVTKKCRNLTKIDPEITYSLWGGFIQYTLAAPTKTLFTRPNYSSISELASSQYHCITADFSKHNEATTNKFSRLLFILEHVKTVPNGRLLLLSSACRSKKVPPIPLGDNLSGTAGQKTLRDAPVVVKLRR
mgnify:CR=1 FL=1